MPKSKVKLDQRSEQAPSFYLYPVYRDGGVISDYQTEIQQRYYGGLTMNNLTIQQFCELETIKTDLQLDGYQYQEKVKDNLVVLEVTDADGNLVRELIIVL